MASGFDELVARLLYDVALSGTGGLGIAELGSAVREFYGTPAAPLEPSGEDLLFSDAPPAAAKQTVDDSLIELAWQWVSKNAEVSVRHVDANVVSEQSGGKPLSPQLVKYANQRLATGEDRVWYAITGHGIDFKRIPPLEFEALSVIASFGARGVLQPQVTKITGQDKRSLPKRTDNLARNGYIVKESVIALNTRTSLLRLKKYAADLAEPADLKAEHGTTVIQYDLWFEGVMRALKENNNVMAFADIRHELGIAGKQHETRALARCVRRLAAVGCIRKVTAREERPGEEDKIRNVRSLQLLREPSAADRIAFMRSDWKGNKFLASATGATGPNRQAEDDLDEDEDADGEYDDDQDGLQLLSKRVHPLWTPDIPFPNFLFNCINDAGPSGTNSAELYDLSVGDFWKRASDEMLMKVTDLWYSSQPPHLRHLAILRDLGQNGKQTVFQYRTYDNFRKAIEHGDTYWDAVIAPESKSKAAKKKAEAAATTKPDLDAWGFPKISPKLLVGQHGAATLQECRKAAPAALVPKATAIASPATSGNVLENPKRQYYQKAAGTSTPSAKKLRKRIENDEKEYAASVRGLAERRALAELRSMEVAAVQDLEPPPEPATAPEADPSAAPASKSQPATPARKPTVLQVPRLNLLLSARQKRDDKAAALTAFVASQTPTGPKKRGNPGKAVRAERERAVAEKARLQREVDEADGKLAAVLAGDRVALSDEAEAELQAGDDEDMFVDTSKSQSPQGDMTAPATPLPRAVVDTESSAVAPTPSPATGPAEETSAATEQAVDSATLEARVAEIEADLLARTKPGVYLNPPGARALKAEFFSSTGRPRNAKIAVIKSDRLKALPWFKEEDARIAPPSTLQRTHSVGRNVVGPRRKKSLRTENQETAEGGDGVAPVVPSMAGDQISGAEASAVEPMESDSLKTVDRIIADVLDQSRTVAANTRTDSPPLDPALRDPMPDSCTNTTTNADAQDTNSPVGKTSNDAVKSVHIDITPKTNNATPASVTQRGMRDAEKAIPTVDTPDAEDLSEQIGPEIPDVSEEDDRKKRAPLRPRPRKGAPEKTGALHIKRREIIMNILETCGGVFPGKNEIWYPFASAWQAQTGATPDKQTVEALLKGMVSVGKLKKLTFTFQSKKGFIVERAIFALPTVDSAAPKVRMLQKRIIDSFPATYIPDGVFISQELKLRLSNAQAMHKSKSNRRTDTPGEDDTYVPPSDLPPASTFRGAENFVVDPTLVVKRTAVGLGAVQAQLEYFKNAKARKLEAAVKGNATKAANKALKAAAAQAELDKLLDEENEEQEEEEISPEQAALQGMIQLDTYRHEPGERIFRRAPNRIGRIVRLGQNNSLPGRLPGKKLKRNALVKGLGPIIKLTQTVPYFPSVAAHSSIPPKAAPRPTTSKPYVPRILRVRPAPVTRPGDFVYPAHPGLYDDNDLANFTLRGPQRDAGPLGRAPTLGILAPGDLTITPGSVMPDDNVRRMPRSLGEILQEEAEHRSADSEDYNSGNEASKFHDEVDAVEAWETRMIKDKTVGMLWRDRPFINHSSPLATWRPATPHMTTPLSAITAEATPIKTAAAYTQVLPRSLGPPKRLREEEPGDSDYVQEQPQPKRKYQSRVRKLLPLGPAIDSGLTPKLKQRDRRAATAFSDRDYDRLTKALSLVWAIAGGVAGRHNWAIVQHALSYRYEASFLRHRWDQAKLERDTLRKQMQTKIWEPFLEAYERDELPLVDFENLENTDWPGLLEWVETQVLTGEYQVAATKTNARNAMPDLPASADALAKDFEIASDGTAYGPSCEDYFVVLTDKSKKNVANTFVFGTELKAQPPTPSYHEGVRQLLRSWARAVALTSDDLYDLREAHRKVSQFGEKVVDDVCRELCTQQVLHLKKIGRRLPGRNYEIHEKFFRVFARWSKLETDFAYLPTVAAKRIELLEILESQDSFELSFTAGDEEMIVITNMVAQGMLKVSSRIPERNDDFDAPFPKLSVWGYSDYNYNARGMDKTRLRFPIVYEKTEAFTADHGLVPDMPIPIEPPQFPDEPGLRIPLWVDIHGNLLPRVWELALRSVLHLMVFRPGIRAEQIQASHKDKLGAWEADMVLEWMEATGLIERVEPGREEDGLWKGGWKASEWWYCALSPDIATWPAAAPVVEAEAEK